MKGNIMFIFKINQHDIESHAHLDWDCLGHWGMLCDIGVVFVAKAGLPR
jgi:hypothetical protein